MGRVYVDTHQFTRNRQRFSSMRSIRIAEATLRKRGIVGDDEDVIGTCFFIPMSMWFADSAMEGVIEPVYSFGKQARSMRPTLIIEADGKMLAKVNGRCSSYFELTGQVGFPSKYAYIEHVDGWYDDGGSMMYVAYNVYPKRISN